MQVLTYQKNGGILWIEVKITGTPTWFYNYQEDQYHDNDSTKNKPKRHTLGFPDELQSMTHNWLFRVANISTNQITCDVEIEWFQDQNGTKTSLLKWNDSVQVGAGSGEETGESLLRNPI